MTEPSALDDITLTCDECSRELPDWMALAEHFETVHGHPVTD